MGFVTVDLILSFGFFRIYLKRLSKAWSDARITPNEWHTLLIYSTTIGQILIFW
jgi:hypothetical protein